MTYRIGKVVLGMGAILLVAFSGLGIAADGSQKDTSVRKYGVAWNVAEDRKIENINGIYQPEDLDKYVKRYFEQVFTKLNELSLKMDSLSGQVAQLDAQIKTLAGKKDASATAAQAKLV